MTTYRRRQPAPPTPLAAAMRTVCERQATRLRHKLTEWKDPLWTKEPAWTAYCARCWGMAWVWHAHGKPTMGGHAVQQECKEAA